jgi:hypothetical protein
LGSACEPERPPEPRFGQCFERPNPRRAYRGLTLGESLEKSSPRSLRRALRAARFATSNTITVDVP